MLAFTLSLQSWISEEQETSQEGITITRVIRNPKAKRSTPIKIKVEESGTKEKFGGVRMEGKQSFTIPTLRDEDDNDGLMETFQANLEKVVGLAKQENTYVRPVRNINLAPNQIDPFVGSSAVKQMIKGGNHSQTMYDPFEKVDRKKLELLLQYVKKDL